MIANEGETARPSFEARFKLILNQAVTDRDRSVARTVSLRETVTTISNQIESQSADLVKLQQLQREAEASRLIYEYFLNRLKETSVQQGIQQADSRLLSQAVVPTRASEPNKSFVLALGALAGAFIGFAMILVFELRFKGFRTAESLEQATGITVMGQIPKIPARRRSNVLGYLSEKPNSTAAEAIRNLRTSIVLSNVDNPPKVIMSTSSLPGEGKTTQSLALAQNFANIGKKVLLVEGDIRRQVFSQYFQIEQKKGLVSVISGDVTLKDAVVRNELMDVDILFGETAEVNAADLFSSEKFRSLIAAMRRDYDIVIIDTPPTLVVPDARVIGQNVDGILYTVKWDSTTHLQVQEGIRMLETVNLKVMGLVLGQIDSRGMRRYGYGGQYGGYGSYANYGSKYHEN
jgi:capsular exopolysaccharide synthesis family protein